MSVISPANLRRIGSQPRLATGLVITLLIVTLGFLTWRAFTRGESKVGTAAEDFGTAFRL